MNVSSLTVSAGPNKESKIVLGDAASAFSLVLKGDTGDFEIRHGGQRSFAIATNGNVDVFGQLKSMGAVKIDGPVNFLGVDQWRLAESEDFNLGTAGWSNDSVSICGNDNKKLLGGYGKFAGGEVYKTYINLPPHKEVRLVASYHFIDAWGGESAYAKIDHRVVWTDSLNLQSSKTGVNICGAETPEAKFSQPIDVILPHSCTGEAGEICSLTVAFGSTLTLAPTEQSWALSDVSIYVR